MFQEVCQLKIGWDEVLPEDFSSRCKELIEDMEKVSSILVPRYILDEIEGEDIKSVAYVAYGANVYIHVTSSNANLSSLLVSKTRVAPLKGETIPHLELMAALTLASLMTAVYEALSCTLKIVSVINWTDSQIVWWRINGESKQFKQFVQNRVEKLLRRRDNEVRAA